MSALAHGQKVLGARVQRSTTGRVSNMSGFREGVFGNLIAQEGPFLQTNMQARHLMYTPGNVANTRYSDFDVVRLHP